MAMHALHKILAAKAAISQVAPGDIVNAAIDLAGINDIYLMVAHSFYDMGGKKVKHPGRVAIFMDHNAPSPTARGADNQKAFREFAGRNGIEHVFGINEGICHLTLQEAGLIKPGSIVILTDSHTTIQGALGAFGTGVGSTDMAVILLEGSLWLRAPQVINVKLEGKLRPGVMAKDAALWVLGKLGTDFANYKAIEFSGSIVRELPVEERMVLCNMAVEMGAKTTYIEPDEKTVAYLRRYTDASFDVPATDHDFVYSSVYEFDLSDLEPLVALPFRVDNVKTVKEARGIPIEQVFIGSCTGGKSTDIEAAARYLRGRKIAKETRLVVTMASKLTLRKAVEKGHYQTLLDAGAAITVPGCGACFGGHSGLLGAGERCAATSNRNFPGRMGSESSEVYLVSPITAAATAVAGRLTHPDLELGGNPDEYRG